MARAAPVQLVWHWDYHINNRRLPETVVCDARRQVFTRHA
jgi:hypothetical protein